MSGKTHIINIKKFKQLQTYYLQYLLLSWPEYKRDYTCKINQEEEVTAGNNAPEPKAYRAGRARSSMFTFWQPQPPR